MKPTPLTDAELMSLHGKRLATGWYVPADFARGLERQLAEARDLSYQKSEVLDSIADALDMPTGSTDAEIGDAALEALARLVSTPPENVEAFRRLAEHLEGETRRNYALAATFTGPGGMMSAMSAASEAADFEEWAALVRGVIGDPVAADPDADLDEPLGEACKLDNPECESCS